MKRIILTLLIGATIHFVFGQARNERPIGSCEDCQLMFEGMPSQIASKVNLQTGNEPGEPLFIQGTIFQSDGKTPAPGIILYFYHTDNKGEYSPAKDQKHGVRHGHLRGWVKSDANGRYEIKTIRPASYPNSRAVQHIHPIILEPGKGYYWIDEYWFDDDPYLTTSNRNKSDWRGGPGIVKLSKSATGEWQGTRNIVLGKNVY